jgi:glycogen synthase
MNIAGFVRSLAVVSAVVAALWTYDASAQTVKVTPLGSHTGELCQNDRGLLFEDPTGVRILYDVGTAIRAFAIVRKRHPDARLTVAGSGPARAKLEALAVELGLADGVTFCGSLENREISTLYASASLMLNPSTVDNMPISILEAWASGVPVVSTNVGGVPYLVDDGRNALLVDPRRPDAMADAALRVLESHTLASSLAKAGRAAAERCAWPYVREAWFDIYAALVLEPAQAKHARASE